MDHEGNQLINIIEFGEAVGCNEENYNIDEAEDN
jgi:hypothetical protein